MILTVELGIVSDHVMLRYVILCVPASCKMGTGSFPGVKCGWGMLLNTYPLLVPRSWKSRAVPVPTLWAIPGL